MPGGASESAMAADPTAGSSMSGAPGADLRGSSASGASVPYSVAASAPASTPAPARPRTRLQDGIRKPKVYSDGTIHYGLSTFTGEPRSVEEALTSKHWKKAMDLEYDALMKNKTWHLVPPRKGINVIDCVTVFQGRQLVTVFVLAHVDDIIVVSLISEETSGLLHELKKDFALNDLGELHYFLGIEVTKVRDGIILSQDKYASDLLKKVNMSSCKPVSTPISTSEKLSAFVGTSLGPNDATNYRSVVGALQYLTLTRPDISFVVNKICQFLHAPTDVHWSIVKRILRYVRSIQG
jgi:hypothetical protein